MTEIHWLTKVVVFKELFVTASSLDQICNLIVIAAFKPQTMRPFFKACHELAMGDRRRRYLTSNGALLHQLDVSGDDAY